MSNAFAGMNHQPIGVTEQMNVLLRSVTTALCLAVVTIPASAHAREVGQVYVREQRTVSVNGVNETWQLVWDGKPATVCAPDEVYTAITCPCAGLAYGEYGKLSLVRRRGGREIEHMDLRPLFGQFDYPDAEKMEGMASVQRWPMEDGDFDRENRGDPGLVSEIKHRRAPVIMRLADYDHDGRATEFLIQVGTMPCGKLQFAAVGVSPMNPRLHALTTTAHPDTPLIMPPGAWRALLNGPGPNTVPALTCGDHGSNVRSDLVVSVFNGEIHAKARDFSCPEDGQAEKLVDETEL